MSALQRIQRLLRLVEVLQSGRVMNSAQLSEYCGISRRTIFRDVETLPQSGLVVLFNEDRQGYSMPANRMLPAANFTLQETLSLLVLCQELSDERRGIPFQTAARSAALKLLSNLPHHLREHICQRTQAIAVRLDPHSGPASAAPIFETLTQAAAERRQVRIRYNSLTEWTEIRTALSPYRILFSRRSWYVIGRSSLHRSVRTFNLGRIQNVECLNSATPSRSDSAWTVTSGTPGISSARNRGTTLSFVSANRSPRTWPRWAGIKRRRCIGKGTAHSTSM